MKKFIPIVIQTEGAFQEPQGLTIEDLENYLDYLKGLQDINRQDTKK